MIESIEILGLRAIRHARISLTPFQVLVGPNASRKSTFFDAIHLVRDFLNAVLAYLPTPPKVVLIEEPENGIHPRAVESVMQSLCSVYNSQIFCATHSTLILSLIRPGDLLCFAKTSKGEVDIVRGDEHPRLKEWKSALHLGDLFAAGVLG